MAIKPDQAKKLTEKERRTISRLEKDIDETISIGFDGSKVEWEIPSTYRYEARILDELKKRYVQAGWNVEIKQRRRTNSFSDPREQETYTSTETYRVFSFIPNKTKDYYEK